MPEMLTKYPESAFAVLKSAGAKCGIGTKKQILTNCPTDHFCALPDGEICVYGLNEIDKMTQFTRVDIANFVAPVPSMYSSFNIILLIISCLFGLFVGMLLKK